MSEIALRIEEGKGLVNKPPNALRLGPASLLHTRVGEGGGGEIRMQNCKMYFLSSRSAKGLGIGFVLLSRISTHPRHHEHSLGREAGN